MHAKITSKHVINSHIYEYFMHKLKKKNLMFSDNLKFPSAHDIKNNIIEIYFYLTILSEYLYFNVLYRIFF